MKMHPSLAYWNVDEVIECLSFGPQREAIITALLAAMPDAYGARPEREFPPEPDADPQFKLKRVWRKLSPEIQAAINHAAQWENGDGY
jgi:hypothetical protein